jgi:flavin reductase (DIM6/NTAB) family NADH-FMN oxidoreductase RutF
MLFRAKKEFPELFRNEKGDQMMTKEREFIEISPIYIDRVIGNYNPVVIITTRNTQGQSNAAPIAMCMAVCHDPPLIAFSVGNSKDTYHNVRETGEFVVNIPGKDILDRLMVTAKPYPPGTNELVEAGLKELLGSKVMASRIKECKLHLECSAEWIKEAGDHFVVLGRVVSASADKEIIGEDFHVRIEKLKPVHYLGKGTDTFLEVGNYIKMKRS